MAGRTDSPRPPRKRSVLRHYSHPFWRDRTFWLVATIAVLASAAFVAVLVVVTEVPATPLDWLRPGVIGLVVLLLSFRLLGMGVTTSVGFQKGLGTPSDPGSGDLEAKGRAAGAIVGRALRATRSPTRGPSSAPASSSMADPEPDPDPGSRGPERPKVTPDRAARVAGAMVGRRLAERRRRTTDEG